MVPASDPRSEISECMDTLTGVVARWPFIMSHADLAAVTGLLELVPELLADYDELYLMMDEVIAERALLVGRLKPQSGLILP